MSEESHTYKKIVFLKEIIFIIIILLLILSGSIEARGKNTGKEFQLVKDRLKDVYDQGLAWIESGMDLLKDIFYQGITSFHKGVCRSKRDHEEAKRDFMVSREHKEAKKEPRSLLSNQFEKGLAWFSNGYKSIVGGETSKVQESSIDKYEKLENECPTQYEDKSNEFKKRHKKIKREQEEVIKGFEVSRKNNEAKEKPEKFEDTKRLPNEFKKKNKETEIDHEEVKRDSDFKREHKEVKRDYEIEINRLHEKVERELDENNYPKQYDEIKRVHNEDIINRLHEMVERELEEFERDHELFNRDNEEFNRKHKANRVKKEKREYEELERDHLIVKQENEMFKMPMVNPTVKFLIFSTPLITLIIFLIFKTINKWKSDKAYYATIDYSNID